MNSICESYELNMHNDNRKKYILSNKIVAILFKRFRKESANDERFKLSDKQELLKKFEAVIKCLRIEILGINELYKKQEDNIELLIELSETVDIKKQIKDLCDAYKKLIKDDSEIEFIIEKNLVQEWKMERKRIWPDDFNITIKEEKS